MNIYSIYSTVSGEGGPIPQGTPVTILRLAGCNLGCEWCDTEHAQNPTDGSEVTNDFVFRHLRECRNKDILITGGEPLLQKRSLSKLVPRLRDHGFRLVVETNGSIKPNLQGVEYVMDYKLPSSGAMEFMLLRQDLEKVLPEGSHIKFVCGSMEDYKVALDYMLGMERSSRWKKFCYLFGVMEGRFVFRTLVETLLRDRLEFWTDLRDTNIQINFQLHKIIWPEEKGGER